jgi:hypothetical protein
MTGRGNRDHLNAGNFKSPKSLGLHLHYASHANTSNAAADHALDAAQCLDQESNGHGREFGVEIAKQCYQPIAREKAVDDERDLWFQVIEEAFYAGAQGLDTLGDR